MQRSASKLTFAPRVGCPPNCVLVLIHQNGDKQIAGLAYANVPLLDAR